MLAVLAHEDVPLLSQDPAPVLTQLAYCASSCASVGLDYCMLLPSLLLAVVCDSFMVNLSTAEDAFLSRLEACMMHPVPPSK